MPTSLRSASVGTSGTGVPGADASLPGEAGGLIGFALTLMAGIGEWGVALFTLLETVFPPIPSEIVLPLAGYLAQLGRMNMVLVIVLSTLGAWVGALLLYALGRRSGWSAPSGCCRGCRWSTARTSRRRLGGSGGTGARRCSSDGSYRASGA